MMTKRIIKILFIVIASLMSIVLALGIIYHVTEPSIKLKGEASMEKTLSEGYQEPGYEAKYWFIDITDRVEVKSDVNDKKVGDYSVNYYVSFLNKESNTVRTVKIVDREPPVITLKEGESISVLTNSKFHDPGYSAEDDSDGDVTESVKVKGIVDTFNPGTYKILYSVTDSHGKKKKKERKIVVEGEPKEKAQKVIFLTFDDGPSDNVTPKILKILKKYNVPATFFIIDYGQSEGKIELLKSAIADGHTIGIHGYSHDYSKIYKSVPAFMKNVEKMDKKIRKDLDYEPFIMRFPGGSSNTVSKNYCDGIMSELVKKVQKEGYYYSDWNVDSIDASGNGVSAKSILSSVKRGCKKEQYNIVLMHDSDAKKTTAEALPKIIEWAKKEGYTFAAMEKGGPTMHHGVNN